MSAGDVSSEVVIKRSLAYVAGVKWWPVVLDGVDVWQLAGGESCAFQVPLGPHTVVVGPVGLWRARSAPFQFEAQAGGRIELAAGGMPITMRAVRLARQQTRAPEGEIVIARQASFDLSRVPWQVQLDGHDAGRLANGKSLALPVPPGPHAVIVGPARRISGRPSVPFWFHAHAGERIEVVTQAAVHAFGLWCSAGTGAATGRHECGGGAEERPR